MPRPAASTAERSRERQARSFAWLAGRAAREASAARAECRRLARVTRLPGRSAELARAATARRSSRILDDVLGDGRRCRGPRPVRCRGQARLWRSFTLRSATIPPQPSSSFSHPSTTRYRRRWSFWQRSPIRSLSPTDGRECRAHSRASGARGRAEPGARRVARDAVCRRPGMTDPGGLVTHRGRGDWLRPRRNW